MVRPGRSAAHAALAFNGAQDQEHEKREPKRGFDHLSRPAIIASAI